ncbi:hypothetical protein CMUS01_10622 [Colletotrichum musicola]|uniref:Fungal N-terminal domain-containing protein n=1 Tax=Colletotrichum musicola TaxID=2175873 RepID=A0A8H6K1V3_9PEZI|nr:hypothetical protein CMUS01_10622 [Colletotrichum musicola]
MAAEGLGLAASVAGLTSLGLQITGGIVKYVDAFKGRREELEFVRRQNEALATTLRAFEQSSTFPTGQSTEVEAAAAANMQLFMAELNGVKALHDELADNRDDRSLATRWQNKKKQVTYAFSQPKVQELGRRLEKATNALQLAMSVMGLQTLRQNTDAIAGISSGMMAVTTPILDINDQLQLLHGGIETNHQILASQQGSLAVQVQKSSDDVLSGVQTINDLLQDLARLTLRQEEEQHKRDQELIQRLAGLLGHVQQKAPRNAKRAAVFKLASEPTFLKEVGDELLPPSRARDRKETTNLYAPSSQPSINATSVHSRHRPVVGRWCTCAGPHSVKERNRMFLGSSLFFSERETLTYWPTCPMARITGKKRVALGVKFNGLAQILKTAIDVSLTLTSGAGGFSISPVFYDTSPTFAECKDLALPTNDPATMKQHSNIKQVVIAALSASQSSATMSIK